MKEYFMIGLTVQNWNAFSYNTRRKHGYWLYIPASSRKLLKLTTLPTAGWRKRGRLALHLLQPLHNHDSHAGVGWAGRGAATCGRARAASKTTWGPPASPRRRPAAPPPATPARYAGRSDGVQGTDSSGPPPSSRYPSRARAALPLSRCPKPLVCHPPFPAGAPI
jgi:hypothetical protein